MPAIRTPTHSTMTTCHDVGRLTPYESILEPSCSSPTCASQSVFAEPTVPNRKRRAPNAFFLFRSYFVANRLYPPEIIHQANVSRYISVVWRNMTAIERSVFFKMAEEEKLRFEVEGPPEAKKKIRTRTKKPRSSNRVANWSKQDKPLEFPQDPTSPSSTSSLSSDPESTSADLFLPSFDFTAPFIDDTLLVSPTAAQLPDSLSSTQHDWNAQPSSSTSPPSDPFYSSEWIHTPTQPEIWPVSKIDDPPLDYALLFDLDFLLSLEMALLSPIEGYFDFSAPYSQLSPFDHCDVNGLPSARL